jgi:hypothetical protein
VLASGGIFVGKHAEEHLLEQQLVQQAQCGEGAHLAHELANGALRSERNDLRGAGVGGWLVNQEIC